MKLSGTTVNILQEIITGDCKLTPYRSGPDLVDLFNGYGSTDVYPRGGGFPPRRQYTNEKVQHLNGSDAIVRLICEVLNPALFIDDDTDHVGAVAHLNKALRFDGYEVVVDGLGVNVRDLHGETVKAVHPFADSDDQRHQFKKEQIKKCKSKLRAGDFDGAITNARSLLEDVLYGIEQELTGEAPKRDGDVTAAFKRVRKLLNLDPAPDLDDALKKVLSGFVQVVDGLAAISNRMADRHARTQSPSKHHAVLVVNSINTLLTFLYDTKQFQADRRGGTKIPSPCHRDRL